MSIDTRDTPETHEHEFELLLGAYALDALDGEERRALETHLVTCKRCQATLVELRSVALGVGLAADEVDPPARVKARVLAYATGEDLPRAVRSPDGFAPRSPGRRASDLAAQRGTPQRSESPVWRLSAAAAVILAIVSGSYALVLRNQNAEMRGLVADSLARASTLANELTAARRDAARLVRVVDVLNAPDLIRVDLRGQAGAADASGRALVSRSHGLLFDARQLPALGAGRVYQLWVIAAGTPVSIGLLTTGSDGAATFSATLPADLATLNAVAVTAEPDGGSKTPTMPILLIGEAK